METKAILRGVRLSEQKGRLVADLVRGKTVEQALNILTFSPKKGAKIIKKVVESAIANAEHNDGAQALYGARQGPWKSHQQADLPYLCDGRRVRGSYGTENPSDWLSPGGNA